MTQPAPRRPFADSTSTAETTPPLVVASNSAIPIAIVAATSARRLPVGLVTSSRKHLAALLPNLHIQPPVFNMIARPLSNAIRSRCLLRQPRSIQGFSTSSNLRGGDHGSHYDPPTGWLFGIKPGQKYAKEGWEGIWYYGFIGSLLVAGVAYVFKPDTSYVSPFVCRHSSARLRA